MPITYDPTQTVRNDGEIHDDTLRELEKLKSERDRLLDEFRAIRDLAYRAGPSGDAMHDALQEIQRRASRLAGGR
jgi:hypothetical protein